jgi:thiamine pyrophosphate-dependent acetolactate synthase large subunit-like protein
VSATPRTEPAPHVEPGFGSDSIAELLRALDFDYIALTPGASFRGLHDSLVNYLGNKKPKILLCVHEEHAVALAHGYTRVTGRPMAVALHANVGLMHATMAIFNAWCDRIPIFILGGVGPMDAVKRRPWVDWIHTSRDLGALIRGYTKWDDQPASIAAALEAMVRAYRIATTAPCGPVFVNLDATIQEEASQHVPQPALDRFPRAVSGDPPADSVVAVAALLTQARRPLLLIGRVSSDARDFQCRVQLAERLDARVLTDLKTGASFPTQHRLHPHAPGLYVSGDAGTLIREADVIVSLDWIDLAGSLRQACGGEMPAAKIVQCSVDQYSHNGWNMDYQSLPPTDVSILSTPDRLVACLLATIGERASRLIATPIAAAAPSDCVETPGASNAAHISIDDLAHTTVDALETHRPSYIRLPIGWPVAASQTRAVPSSLKVPTRVPLGLNTAAVTLLWWRSGGVRACPVTESQTRAVPS